MLTISSNIVEALITDGRSRLCRCILDHWFETLRDAGFAVGPEGRDRILEDIRALSEREPTLTEQDLVIFADLLLVSRADLRRREHP